MLHLFRADMLKAVKSLDEHSQIEVCDEVYELGLDDMPEKAFKSPFAAAGWLYKNDVVLVYGGMTRNEACAIIAKAVVRVTRDFDRFHKRQLALPL